MTLFSWNPSSCNTMTYVYYIINIIAADGMATQGARASSTMILHMLNLNNSVPKGLNIIVSSYLRKVFFYITPLPAKFMF